MSIEQRIYELEEKIILSLKEAQTAMDAIHDMSTKFDLLEQKISELTERKDSK